MIVIKGKSSLSVPKRFYSNKDVQKAQKWVTDGNNLGLDGTYNSILQFYPHHDRLHFTSQTNSAPYRMDALRFAEQVVGGLPPSEQVGDQLIREILACFPYMQPAFYKMFAEMFNDDAGRLMLRFILENELFIKVHKPHPYRNATQWLSEGSMAFALVAEHMPKSLEAATSFAVSVLYSIKPYWTNTVMEALVSYLRDRDSPHLDDAKRAWMSMVYKAFRAFILKKDPSEWPKWSDQSNYNAYAYNYAYNLITASLKSGIHYPFEYKVAARVQKAMRGSIRHRANAPYLFLYWIGLEKGNEARVYDAFDRLGNKHKKTLISAFSSQDTSIDYLYPGLDACIAHFLERSPRRGHPLYEAFFNYCVQRAFV